MVAPTPVTAAEAALEGIESDYGLIKLEPVGNGIKLCSIDTGRVIEVVSLDDFNGADELADHVDAVNRAEVSQL